MSDHAPKEGPGTTVGQLRALLEKATPGPWEPDGEFLFHRHSVTDKDGVWPATRIVCRWESEWDYQADQALIAALRNAAPELLDLAEEALRRREFEAEREKRRTVCQGCGATPKQTMEGACVACGYGHK